LRIGLLRFGSQSPFARILTRSTVCMRRAMVPVVTLCMLQAIAAAPSVVVALAGGSGSGKNYIADHIKDVFGHENVSSMSHDWYYKDQTHLCPEERDRLNFDHPNVLESSLMLEHIQGLRDGETVEAPVYDFETHSRSGSRQVAPAPLVLVDGILVLAEPMLAKAFDIRIYVDTPADIRLLRRIKRDMVERGRSVESIMQQYEETVRPMHELFVEPSRSHADITVAGTVDASLKSLFAVVAGTTGLTPSTCSKEEL